MSLQFWPDCALQLLQGAYAYRTGSVLIGRIHKRVYKGDRLGLFWFNVALMWIFFLAGILAVAWAIIDPSAFH